MSDPFTKFKQAQGEAWALFTPLEAVTTIPAAKLVRFARITRGETVLDAGSGTGVVAVTAARAGATVRALDLSPALVEVARRNASLAAVAIDFVQGDVEALPYPDASFDVVVSQFGHMFAPRPEVAIGEMLRVLKPGGRIAFSTWPPEHFVGMVFQLVSRYVTPPDPPPAPPPQWGDVNVVRSRLGDRVKDITFDRDVMLFPTLSPQHYRASVEATLGPVVKLVASLSTSDPERLAKFRSELEALGAANTVDNALVQHFLMTRATKV